MLEAEGTAEAKVWWQDHARHGFPSQTVLREHTSRASLVAQTVRNLPAVQETRVQPLGREDPLEKEMAPHYSILAWETP